MTKAPIVTCHDFRTCGQGFAPEEKTILIELATKTIVVLKFSSHSD
jgi:hypothetical protein